MRKVLLSALSAEPAQRFPGGSGWGDSF